jgi:capsular polysaccharide biosynthesis protein
MMSTHQGRPVGTIENEVLIGHQDTLFLAGGAHAVADFATGSRAAPEQSFRMLQRNVRERAEWARQRGIGYVHAIFPDKQSIVPERWPLGNPMKLGQLWMEQFSDHFPVVYPVGVLANQADDTISLTDTHVTDYGSIVAAGLMVECLVGLSQDQPVARLLDTIDAVEEWPGDLGSKLHPPVTSLQRYSTAQAPGRWLHNNLQGSNNGLVDLRFCRAPAYDKRLVIFGDSFARQLGRFLQFWFREVIFFRSGFFDPDLAAQCQPDFLLTENVERYLDHCQPDDERPSFFMYPHLRGGTYAPSAEFAAVFSAILSVPRKPYLDFRCVEFGDAQLRPSASIAGETGRAPHVVASTAQHGAFPIQIEPVQIVPRTRPFFIDVLPEAATDLRWPDSQDIHGSVLVRRSNILLFGPSIQVDRSGNWSCESQAFGEQFIDMVASDGYQRAFPGPKPHIERAGRGYRLNFAPISDQIVRLDEPLFLATPLEPTNWGRWVSTFIPKASDFRQFGTGRKMLCYRELPWQRALMDYIGIEPNRVISHDPGRTYICNDLMSVEYSVTNMTASERERAVYAGMRDRALARQRQGLVRPPGGEKVFISRIGRSAKNPSYRVLQNEAELADRLRALGFDVIEPETLSFDEQILTFANARMIVCLGGAALYNAVFCAPDVLFVTIESSDAFLRPHCELLSSLHIRYGVLIGQQDPLDEAPVHKRWTVDVEAACRRIQAFASNMA